MVGCLKMKVPGSPMAALAGFDQRVGRLTQGTGVGQDDAPPQGRRLDAGEELRPHQETGGGLGARLQWRP